MALKKKNVLCFYIKIWQVVVSQRLAAVWNLKPCWWVFQLRQLLGVSCTWMSPLPTPVLWQHLAVAGVESGRFFFPVHVKKPICQHHPFTTGSGQSHIGKFKFSKIHIFFLQAWIYHVQQMVSLLFPLSWQPHFVSFWGNGCQIFKS